MTYILKVEKDKNINRELVEFDDGKSLSIHKKVTKYFKIKEYSHINMDNIIDNINSQELTFAKEYCLYLIGQSARSRKQIVDKMRTKGYQTEIIEQAMVFLDEYELLNDKEYASNYINSRSNRYGKNRLKYDLKSKGINDDILEEVLEEVDPTDEYEVALELGKQRMNSYRDDDRQKKYRKLGGYLQRRGFSMNIVKKVLSELL